MLLEELSYSEQTSFVLVSGHARAKDLCRRRAHGT